MLLGVRGASRFSVSRHRGVHRFIINLFPMPAAVKSKKKSAGVDATAYKVAQKSLGPNPKRNNPWALAKLKRERASNFSEGCVRSNLLASAYVLESDAQFRGIPKPN
jgi:hypothetical protein